MLQAYVQTVFTIGSLVANTTALGGKIFVTLYKLLSSVRIGLTKYYPWGSQLGQDTVPIRQHMISTKNIINSM